MLRVFADTQMRDMTWHDVANGFTREQVRDWIADDLRECTEHGKEHGVIIGVQNHGDFLRTSDDLIELVGLVDSPWCGAIVDTGYFRSADPYVDMKKAAPYAVNWQVSKVRSAQRATSSSILIVFFILCVPRDIAAICR